MDSQQLDEKAAALIREAAEQCNQPTGFSSMSPTIYDTAWVAMVSKTVHEDTRWLFPGCFDFLLNRQMTDGGWGASTTEEDGILNTMAAMLALKLHADAPHYSGCPLPKDIEARISKADAYLQQKLKEWKVEESWNIGFEILIPTHLRLLERQGFSYQLPGREALMNLNREKLAKFNPEFLYGTRKTSLIHSLEAFVGIIDFDKVSHHRRGGSMMGSPSSTAAFLMYNSSWYNDTEEFLSTVAAVAQGTASGGIPTVFPATTFMLCWATSTLLGSGYSVDALGLANLQIIGDFLTQQLQAGNGLVGFAPNYLEDADDTAKAVISLNLLGRPTSPDAMVAAFEAKSHFITFPNERNPSFSANCHVLMSLLSVEEPRKYAVNIHKVATFLCDSWYRGENIDKWNKCPHYPWMLLAQALVRLLYVWNAGELDASFEKLVRDRIPIVLCQILSQTLRDLGPTQPREMTAYAILTLTSLSTLPWFNSLEAHIASAVQSGRDIIIAAMGHPLQQDSNWVAKVSYHSSYLCDTYCLAALKAVPHSQELGSSVENLTKFSGENVNRRSRFFMQLPLFTQEPEWKIRGSMIEGYLFYPQLQRIQYEVYSRKEFKKSQYIEYNALCCVLSNNCRNNTICAALLWDLMVFSMLAYQLDEYMESFVDRNFADNLEPVRHLVNCLCELSSTSQVSDSTVPTGGDFRTQVDRESNDVKSIPQVHCGKPNQAFYEVSDTLSRHMRWIQEHPSVRRASPADRKYLTRELCTALQTSLTQIEVNARFRAQKPAAADCSIISYTNSTISYFDWVQTVSASHVLISISFAFLACLVSGSSNGSDCFDGVRQRYLFQTLCHHLSAMGRQQNDYGSIARDSAEGNVNSMHFPEFHQSVAASHFDMDDARKWGVDREAKEAAIKAALLEIIGAEREIWVLAMGKLKGFVSSKVWKMLSMFVHLTELYGQMYIARDVGMRTAD